MVRKHQELGPGASGSGLGRGGPVAAQLDFRVAAAVAAWPCFSRVAVVITFAAQHASKKLHHALQLGQAYAGGATHAVLIAFELRRGRDSAAITARVLAAGARTPVACPSDSPASPSGPLTGAAAPLILGRRITCNA